MNPFTYDINFIMELSKNIPEKNLNNDVENYLNNVLADIKKSFNNTGTVFRNNNSYNKNNRNPMHFKNNRRHNNYKDEVNKNTVSKDELNKTSADKYDIEKNLTEKLIIEKSPVQSYRVSRMCFINGKTDYELIITNIRKILNKIQSWYIQGITEIKLEDIRQLNYSYSDRCRSRIQDQVAVSMVVAPDELKMRSGNST